MTYQTTLATSIDCTGTGLHTGAPVYLAITPAPADSGIVFRRTDVDTAKSVIPARYDLVSETRLGTTIENKHGVKVATVEHLMAALAGLGIDNAHIEISGPEVPIMDGSSEPFVFMLECAGIRQLSAKRKVIRVLKTVTVTEGSSTATVEPLDDEFDDGMTLDVTIDFNHPVIRTQRAYLDFRRDTFRQALSRARTFGFAHEVEALRKMGLARGGSLENAIVLDQEKILNEGGLRFRDEFVRHKALDCVGDLALAGRVIHGQFSFTRPGHSINNKLLRALLADISAWKLAVEGDDTLTPPAIARGFEPAVLRV